MSLNAEDSTCWTKVDNHFEMLSLLLDLPTEIRLKIWSFCVPDNVEAIVCHCFNDQQVHQKCWEARQCLTIEINEDIILPAPPLLLVSRQTHEESKSFMRPHLTIVLCQYVCTVMFLYNSTHRQRAQVDKIRVVEAVDRPPWHPASTGNMVGQAERVLMDRLFTAAVTYYDNVKNVQLLSERNGHNSVGAEVEVRSVNLDAASSEGSCTTEQQRTERPSAATTSTPW